MPKGETRKLAAASVLAAVGVLLPMALHVFGSAVAGQVFLPMHIPVLLAGFLLGPVWGGALGLITPALGCLINGMPAPARLPFMMGELLGYGATAGIFYRGLGLSKKKGGALVSLFAAMVCGRAVYALMLAAAAGIFGIKCGGAAAALTAAVTGLPGIAVQTALVPAVVYAVRKAGYFDD